MKFTSKIALAALSASALAACSSGGGSSAPSSVSGGASKGIIIGGLVSAYEINNGEYDTTTNALATSTTDDSGNYSLTLPSSYDGGPLLLEISMVEDNGAVTTTMKCDLPAGCGTDVNNNPIGFGALYTPASGFTMRAVIGSASGTVNTAITPLTNIGAALAEETLADLGDDSLVKTAVEIANSKVANRFGLNGSLTDQPIVDITDPNAANAANGDALQVAALSAAVVAAVQGDNAGSTIEGAVQNIADTFANGNGIADTEGSDTAAVTLEEILEEAQAVYAQAEAEIKKELGDDAASEDFEAAQADANTAQTTAEGGSTEASQGNPSDNAGDDALQKGKDLIQDLRNIANGMAEESIENTLGSFADEVDMVTEMAGEEVDAALEVTGLVLGAMAQAYVDYTDEEDDSEEGEQLQQVEAKETEQPSYVYDGVSVDVSEDDNGVITLVVQGEVEGADVDMTGVVDFEVTEESETGDDVYDAFYDDCFDESWDAITCEGEAQYAETFKAVLDNFQLQGSVVEGDVTFTVVDTTKITASIDESFTDNGDYEQTVTETDTESDTEYEYTRDSEETYTYTEDLAFDFEVDFDIQLEIAFVRETEQLEAEREAAQELKTTAENNATLTFSGSLDALLTDFVLDAQGTETRTVDETETESTYEFSDSYRSDGTETITFTTASFGLSGSVANDLGEQVGLVLSASLDGRNATVTETNDDEYTYSYVDGEETVVESYEGDDYEESASNFVGATVAASITATVPGLSDDVTVSLTGNRNSFEKGTVRIVVAYEQEVEGGDPVAIRVTVDAEAMIAEQDGTATVTNQDGATANLDLTDDELTGTIMADGTTVGTISESGIRFIDGTLESF